MNTMDKIAGVAFTIVAIVLTLGAVNIKCTFEDGTETHWHGWLHIIKEKMEKRQ